MGRAQHGQSIEVTATKDGHRTAANLTTLDYLAAIVAPMVLLCVLLLMMMGGVI